MATASHGRRTIAVVALIPFLAALALWAFAWPTARMAPRHLPLGVGGPAAATAQVENGSRSARARSRSTVTPTRPPPGTPWRTGPYTARSWSPRRAPNCLTASAAGPLVAPMLQQAVAQQVSGGRTPVRTVDVVAAPATDSHGAEPAAEPTAARTPPRRTDRTEPAAQPTVHPRSSGRGCTVLSSAGTR